LKQKPSDLHSFFFSRAEAAVRAIRCAHHCLARYFTQTREMQVKFNLLPIPLSDTNFGRRGGLAKSTLRSPLPRSSGTSQAIERFTGFSTEFNTAIGYATLVNDKKYHRAQDFGSQRR
jgi:hypothetical protein